MTPQIGDFAVLPIAGQTGKLISFGEWLNGSAFGHYDHAEIFISNNQTMGAYPGGARLVTMPVDQSQWLWSTGRIELTDEQRRNIVSNAMACAGTGYSFLDYLALADHRLHIPAPGLKSYIASTKHMICSQLVDKCYADAGVHLFNDGRWPGFVTPADLAAVIEHPERIRIALWWLGRPARGPL